MSPVDLVCIHEAEPGLRPDVPLDPQQIVDRVLTAGCRAHPVVNRRQHREVGTEGLAGQLGRGHRLDDPAGVDQLVGRRELLDAIEEEGSLLREENFLSGIEGKLLRV